MLNKLYLLTFVYVTYYTNISRNLFEILANINFLGWDEKSSSCELKVEIFPPRRKLDSLQELWPRCIQIAGACPVQTLFDRPLPLWQAKLHLTASWHWNQLPKTDQENGIFLHNFEFNFAQTSKYWKDILSDTVTVSILQFTHPYMTFDIFTFASISPLYTISWVTRWAGTVSDWRSFEACKLVSPQATFLLNFYLQKMYHFSTKIYNVSTKISDFEVQSEIPPHDKSIFWILDAYCFITLHLLFNPIPIKDTFPLWRSWPK